MQIEPTDDQREWLAQRFEALTTELVLMSPSEWAKEKRYLPPSVTALPGYYDFDVTPYLKEIVDCLAYDSPVREVAIMKGVQLGLTVGVLENAIGYYIDHVKTAPMMLVTADAELAKARMESNITPMLQLSRLEHLIKSADEKNLRKSGKTDRKIEWLGGGYLVPFGAVNANKLRSVSIQVMLRDEIDGWPDIVGKDGDPIKLSADRTAAYESSRKILDISTPTIKGQSKIEKRFKLGDQRKYYVCCLGCGFPQVLRWRHMDNATGEVGGVVWETESGRLVPGSVRYLCRNCGHGHTNDDKIKLLSPTHGAEWRPTAASANPEIRSYHINALYSPVGMQTWEACVGKWLEAWDVDAGRPRDMGQLQVFYNNVLGETFELRGEKLRFEQVSAHRRHEYQSGEIPNQLAARVCGGPVLVLVCAVDVHKDNLAVGVFGWCAGGRAGGGRAFLIEYKRLGENPDKPGAYAGDTENLDDPLTWGALRKLIEEREYIADDGKRYRIQLTLIDSGYRSDDVYRFAAEYAAGVYPVKGRDLPPKSARFTEFSDFTTPMGTTAYGITVNIYKDRWSSALRRGWDGVELQPEAFFNAPLDVTDKQLRELTVEVKRERIDPRTKQRIGWEWYRPAGVANELWDVLIYANAAFDMLAWDVCRRQLELEQVDWMGFYELCSNQKLFFSEG